VQRINSQALSLINRSLGITGTGSQQTEFEDGNLQQTIDVADLIRRGNTQGGTGGIYIGALTNIHGASGVLHSAFQLYSSAAGVIAPYPNPMPIGFDVWILGASVRRVSGTGTVEALLNVNTAAAVQGWGVDDSGSATTTIDPIFLAHWDTIVTIGVFDVVMNEGGQPYQPINWRIVRPPASDTAVQFSTDASALATYRCMVLVGVFPIGLGQDVAE